MEASQQIAFPPFTLDSVNECLWRNGEALALTPKAYAVLRVLIDRAGQLVTKDALLQTVWPGTYVTDTALKVCINGIRTVLGDDAKSPRFIETVHRRGYRFIAKVVSSQLEEANQKAKGKNQKVKVENLPPAPSIQHPAPTLVGREAELTQLHQYLAKALRGERQLVFVTGEAGIGKTTLIDAFRQRLEIGDWRLAPSPQASSLQPLASPTWIARGQCVEHYGAGEAYLPVFDALGRLCRDPGGARLIALLRQHAPLWLSQMPALLSPDERAVVQREIIGATPERMLREMVDTLEVLTLESPLVLVLEDLQWSDYATLSLLTALARRREAACLLVIASYRPIDVIISDHPVKQMKQELHAHRLCVELAPELLTETEVLTYLSTRFFEERANSSISSILPLLARALHHRTGGNPLFLFNVVTDLVTRGIVVKQQGQWHVTVPVGEIELSVPASLRPLIEQHIGRLTLEEQRILEMLSVAGEEVAVAILADCLEEALRVVEERCERLTNREQLLRAYGSEKQTDGTITERYGLSHALYQQVLYERLSESRRARLHQRLGEVKEGFYAAHASEHAAELALHFERGQNVTRALYYFSQAAPNAMQRYAYREAIEYFTKAISLLQSLPDTPERTQQEFTLQINQGLAFLTVHGEGSPAVTQALRRAQELSQRSGNPLQLWYALVGQWSMCMFRGEISVGYEIASQLLHLVEQGHSGSLLGGHLTVGFSHVYAGRFAAAQDHFDRVLILYDTEQHRSSLHALVSPDMVDPRVVCGAYTAQLLWFRGYADQARTQMEEVYTLAQNLAQPYLVATALNLRTMLATAVEPVGVVARYAVEHIEYATQQGFPHWATLGMVLQGWALARQGQTARGVEQITQGLAAWRDTGMHLGQTYILLLLAEAYGRDEQEEEGLQILAKALALVEHTGEYFNQAELYRFKGELMLQRTSQKSKIETRPRPLTLSSQEAEACFLKAIEIAQQQQAKLLELRATVSLARLWYQEGKSTAARRVLEPLYAWFTEGFTTADLRAAKSLLDSLASASPDQDAALE